MSDIITDEEVTALEFMPRPDSMPWLVCEQTIPIHNSQGQQHWTVGNFTTPIQAKYAISAVNAAPALIRRIHDQAHEIERLKECLKQRETKLCEYRAAIAAGLVKDNENA